MTAPLPPQGRALERAAPGGSPRAQGARRVLDGPLLARFLAGACAALLAWLLIWGDTPTIRVLVLAAGLAPLALAGLYRPFGAGSLGLGAFVAPLAAATGGATASAFVVAGAAFLCATVRHRLLRPPTAAERGTSRDRRGALRRAADALGLATTAWVAALPIQGAASGPLDALSRELLSVVLFAAGARLVERLPALGRLAPAVDPPWPREILGALWDGLGWALGLAAVRLVGAGWPALLPLLIALAALGAVAGVQAARQHELTRAVGELERLVALGRTDTAPHRAGLAARIQREIAAIVDYHWFELQLAAEFDHPPVLTAHRSGELREGPAQPGPYPPASAPGIRRRRSWLVVERELRGQGRSFGTVKLWCDPRQVAAGDLELLEHLLGQLGGQLERLWLQREATEDPLTKLARRKVFEERLARELARTRERGAPLSLVVLDLDHFKGINDRWGHLAGDRALSHVAAVLLSQLGGDKHLCCRWGGEEFVVLLPNTAGAEALLVAERLRLAIAATAVFVDGGGVIAPTISAGVAATPEIIATTENDLFELADRALYAAKAHGRNRCLHAVEPSRFRGVDGTIYGEEAPRKAAPRL